MTLPEPARFALVTNGLASGSDAQAQLLARALVFAGQEAALLTIRPSRAPDLEALGVPVAVVGQRGCAPGPRTTVETVRVLRRRPPDGVVSFGYHAHLLGRSAGRITGVPTIVSVIRNESVVGCTREFGLRATDELATLSTTNSESAAAELVARSIVPAGRIAVVPDGIDLARYPWDAWLRATTRGQLGITGDTFLWLSAGPLEPRQDLELLLDAFAITADPRARLAIAGDGGLLGPLQARASSLRIDARVVFLGTVDDVPALLAAADAVVWTARWEGSPGFVLEAMAAGRPVVATATGSVRELVSDESGVVVARRTPWHLAHAMEQVALAPASARTAMGIAGRERAAERHSVEIVSRRWLRVLTDAGAFTPREPPSPRLTA